MDVYAGFTITVLVSFACAALAYFGFSKLNRARVLISRARADRIFIFCALGYAVIFSILSILRHWSMHTGGYDLGIFDQAVWNSLHGRLLESSLVPDTPTLLGQRFDPILLAFVPLYAISSDPVILLIIQTIALTLAAFPIYWFARDQIGSGFALVIANAYFLYPPLEYVNLFDFHEVAFSALFISFAVYFLWREHFKGLLVCVLLALLTKEEIAFTVIFFGGFIFFVQRKRWLGLALAALGIVWGIVVLQFVIPFFRGGDFGGEYYYFGHGMNAAHRYDYLGNSVRDVIVTLLTRPDIYLPQVLTPAKFEYGLHFLIPLAFIPLLGFELFALALPTLGVNVLSNFLAQYTIETHYAGVMLSIPFFATALGLRRILNRANRLNRNALRAALGVLILVSTVLSYFFHAPGPGARRFESQVYSITPHILAGYALMAELPVDKVVVTQKQLAPHLSQRREIYEHPFILDYAQTDYLFVDTAHPWYSILRQSWDEWFATGYFEKIKEHEGYFIARRILPRQMLDISYADQFTMLGFTLPVTGTIRGGQRLLPIIEWRAEQPGFKRYKFHVSLVDEAGHLWAEVERAPHNGFSRVEYWKPGRQFGDQYALDLPITMPPGNYQIKVGIKDPDTNQYLAANRRDQIPGDALTLATVRIEKNKTNVLARDLIDQLIRDSKPPYVLFVDSQEIRMFGYLLSRLSVAPGEAFQLGLYWRAREKPRGDYIVAVQLRDQNDLIALEQSMRPANNAYPTLHWDEGEVVLDWHDVSVPRSVGAGAYQLFVVVRDGTTGKQLSETKLATMTVTR